MTPPGLPQWPAAVSYTHLDVYKRQDYLHETDDDPQGLGNAGFLRDLILGRAPGPDWPVVEELRVPILMTPGNHDYRRHPYHLSLIHI